MLLLVNDYSQINDIQYYKLSSRPQSSKMISLIQKASKLPIFVGAKNIRTENF